MRKRVLSVLIVLCLVLSLLPATVWAEDPSGTCGENLTWKLENNELTISIMDGMGPRWDMTDYPHGENPPWYSYRNQIHTVIIEDGVTRIGARAFSGCSNLTSVSISRSVDSIGPEAFEQCSSLTGIDVSVENPAYESIDGVLFSRGWSILVYPAKKAGTSYSIPNTVTRIEGSAFEGCGSLTDVTIGSRVDYIGAYAFNGCSSLKSVTIPSSVNSVNTGIFKDCVNLNNIYFGGNREEWQEFLDLAANVSDNELLRGFTNVITFVPNGGEMDTPTVITKDGTLPRLPAITHPDDHTFLGWYTADEGGELVTTDTRFTDGMTVYARWRSDILSGTCGENLIWTLENNNQDLTISGTGPMKDYNNNLFEAEPWYRYRTQIRTAVIGDGVTEIGRCAFWECGELTRVDIGDSVTRIGSSVFAWCYKLTDVTIPGSVTRIQADAFAGCISLESVIIPDNVESISFGVFNGCSGLNSVIIGSGINVIGSTTFYGCSNLTSVTIPASVTKIESAAFAYCESLNNVYFGGSPDEWQSLLANTDGSGSGNGPLHAVNIVITFDPIDRSDPSDPVDYVQGTVDTPTVITKGGTLPKLPTAARSGYTFDGWYTSGPEGTEVEVTEGHSFTTNTAVYAHWIKNSTPPPTMYTVNFDSQGGSTVPAQTIADGGTVTKPADPTREGYTFGGWFKEAACTTEWKFETDTVTGNITLYAKWTANTPSTPSDPVSYTVTFDSQGGSTVPAQTIADGGMVTKPADPTRNGYTFGGWFKETACTTEWKFETDAVTRNITLYAKWIADTSSTPSDPASYTVTFDSQGGSAVADQVVADGGTVTKPADPTREGYTFGGWFTEAACSDGTEWDFESDTVTEDITLYAKWIADTSSTPSDPASYTVTFDSQGGSAVADQVVADGGTVTKPADPTRSGHTFGGWFTEAACTTEWKFETDTVTGDITLYAKWTKTDIPSETGTYAIRIGSWLWDGEIYLSHTYAVPGTWVTVTVYPDAGYVVDWVDVARDDNGSYLSVSRSGRQYSFIMPDSDVTVYAGFALDTDTYEVWVASGIQHGDVYTSHTYARPGTRVTITAYPDSYYVLDWIRAEREDTGRSLSLSQSGSRYTFTMPYSSVFIDAGFSSRTYVSSPSQITIQATRPTTRPTTAQATTQTTAQASTPAPAFTQAASVRFTDVQPGTYCYDAVAWTVGNRIASGYGDGTFRPEAACSRADFVTYLWHAAGSPSASSRANPFVDVDPGAYYYEAMLWALEKGVTSGSGANTFDPYGTCTRAQIITFLWRAHGRPAVVGGPTFSDVPAGSYYANAVAWAVFDGVATGVTAAAFEPESICTRGQCVTFLYRVLTGQ